MTSSLMVERPTRLGHGGGFWAVAAAFGVSLAFSTLPTPLYRLYQARDGFPTAVVTVVFAAYAIGVVASTYLVGHISDRIGRRRMVLASVLAEIVAAVLFLAWPEVPGLIIARFVCGTGIGALTATATAHLAELRAVAHPGRDAGLFSSMLNMAGLGLGPVVGGVLASYVTAPLTVPYLVFLVLLVAVALAVRHVPETVERSEDRLRYRPQRVSVPPHVRPVFWAAAAVAFVGNMFSGLVSAVSPTLLAGSFHIASPLVGGLLSTSVFAAAAGAQLLFVGQPLRQQLITGLGAMIVSLAAIPAGVLAGSVLLFWGGALFGGAGMGLTFRVTLAMVGSLATPELRGETLAGVFLAFYLGLALPVLGIGVALTALPSLTVLVLFGLVELVLVVWAGRRLLTQWR
ncbi:MFS transporter [Kutzneria sp. CA-103260]|uniref:MFS transporter n=1 Tax=Kutzneria sp. CA-103260 TaxID=2802641 RepID=UPI001BADCD62|nr:MFS transporter [Kutzneria sp. CA-103260]QUQ67595.1 MFS transporter [Kutzneria sp. CA-103260]